MDLNIDHPGELELIWESQILPLLADQFHGTGVDVEVEYGLDSLRGGLTDASPTGV
jgi:5-methylcytosine-specific restriction protein B